MEEKSDSLSTGPSVARAVFQNMTILLHPKMGALQQPPGTALEVVTNISSYHKLAIPQENISEWLGFHWKPWKPTKPRPLASVRSSDKPQCSVVRHGCWTVALGWVIVAVGYK
jgi:hypothetical protein